MTIIVCPTSSAYLNIPRFENGQFQKMKSGQVKLRKFLGEGLSVFTNHFAMVFFLQLDGKIEFGSKMKDLPKDFKVGKVTLLNISMIYSQTCEQRSPPMGGTGYGLYRQVVLFF